MYIRILVLALLLAVPLRAAETKPPAKPTPEHKAESATGQASVTQHLCATYHSIKLHGKTLDYTATAGYLLLRDDQGKLQAKIFFVAYTKQGVSDLSRRPISFAFNGGPGASTVFLHLGGLGPIRVPLGADGTKLPARDELTENAQTWLEFTDLVFVDPIGTGYSRAAKGVDAKTFYDVRKDIDVAADFIRLYVTTYHRWLSPKFVIGESYGTTRAAGLASQLQNKGGINLAGVILLSTALDFQAFQSGNGNDLPYALDLPTFTAVAAYHHVLPAESSRALHQTLARAADWALNDYLTALAKGDTISHSERARVVAQLTQYTGLPTNYIEASRCRISASRFAKELLRSRNRTVGLLDGRVIGINRSRLGEYPRYDPAMFLVTGPYKAALIHYLRQDLNFKSTRDYKVFSGEVNHDWKWDTGGGGYPYVAGDLADAMSKDPRFRVFVGAGMYDLTTPYLGQQYTFDHLGLDPALRRNITFRLYPSGHQIYTDNASLKRLTSDVTKFVKQTLPGRQVPSKGKSKSRP